LKQNLVHALEAKSGSQEEQLSLVQKSSEMNSELVALQSKLKDEELKRNSLEKSCDGMKVLMNKGISNGFLCKIASSMHGGCCETFGKRKTLEPFASVFLKPIFR
jgi:hypothetical protein